MMERVAQVFECPDDVCVTCADHAAPVRVIELIESNLARVDTGAGIEVISVALVEVRAGDVLLVHAKEAIAKLDASAKLNE